jgi:hypothetical protein
MGWVIRSSHIQFSRKVRHAIRFPHHNYGGTPRRIGLRTEKDGCCDAITRSLLVYQSVRACCITDYDQCFIYLDTFMIRHVID